MNTMDVKLWILISTVTKNVRSAGRIMAASIPTVLSLWFVFKTQSEGETFGALRSGFLSADEIICFIRGSVKWKPWECDKNSNHSSIVSFNSGTDGLKSGRQVAVWYYIEKWSHCVPFVSINYVMKHIQGFHVTDPRTQCARYEHKGPTSRFISITKSYILKLFT
jgi:hypothetical protein